MGKTHQPLTILIHRDLADAPLWQELREKGHTVDVAYSDEGHVVVLYDAYFGPNAWWMTKELLPYARAGMARARKVKYGKPNVP